MYSIVPQQPTLSAVPTSNIVNNANVGDFAELFNEILASNSSSSHSNDGTSEPSSVTPGPSEDLLDSFDLGISAADLFPADIFPSLIDNPSNTDADVAMPSLDDPIDLVGDSISTPEQSDSDSGVGSNGTVVLGAAGVENGVGSVVEEIHNGCCRTRPFDWRRSRERAPDDCTRLRVEDFVSGDRLAGFLTQSTTSQTSQQPPPAQQQQFTSATQLFKSEPIDEFLAQHQATGYRLIQPRQQLLLHSQQQQHLEASPISTSASQVSSPSLRSSVASPAGSTLIVASGTGQTVVAQQAQLTMSSTSANSSFSAAPVAALSETDQAKVKRIERMIKNRHSASESRRKRKEYLDGLERRVQSLASENAFLRDENSQLRQRYSELERKLISLEQALGSGGTSSTIGGRRRPVTAMAVLLFLGLNLVGLGVWPLRSGGQQSPLTNPSVVFFSEQSRALVPYRRGAASSASRHLLSAPEPAPEELSALFGRLCPVHNSTESARLAKELDGWAFRYQREAGARELRRLHRQRTRREEPLRRRAEATAAAAAATVSSRDAAKKTTDGGSALQLRLGRDTSLDLLMRALDRREDTMYLVSFRSDHLVFPALAANKTAAPRMTFLMPAVNESGHASTKGTVPLMQIDCEVVNVGLMHLDKWRVPLQFRQDLFGNNRV